MSTKYYGTKDTKLLILLLFSVQVLNVFLSAWAYYILLAQFAEHFTNVDWNGVGGCMAYLEK